MGIFINFEFLAILNLLVCILYPSFSPFFVRDGTNRYHPFNIIMLILTVIAVIADIIFLVLRAVHA